MDAPRTPAVDPAILLYLELTGYVVVPLRCVSQQGLESRLRPDPGDIGAPCGREWIPQGPTVPRRVLRATATVFGVTIAELVGASRAEPIVSARRCGMYFAQHWLGYASGQVASMFGGRDPSTVRAAYRTVRARLADPDDRPAIEIALRRIWADLADGESA